jgi:hypothetical protein
MSTDFPAMRCGYCREIFDLKDDTGNEALKGKK